MTRSPGTSRTCSSPPLAVPVTTPRLIATDLDGTLLRDDKTVSDRTVAALAAAGEAGIEILFVTGRPARWMECVVAHAGRLGMAICANGAGVYDLRGQRMLTCSPLAEPSALAVARALRARVPGTSFAIERAHSFHYEPEFLSSWPMPDSRVGPLEDLLGHLPEEPLLKLLARHQSADPDAFLATARSVAGEHAEFTRSNPSALLEVSATGVSKATALARCCADLGITADQVVAVGDMPNDLDMLRWAGTSYAVANAHPTVLAATTHRTAGNEADGVALVVEAILANA